MNAEAADNSSISPAISGDGRFVTFVSWAANLAPGYSGSEARVFVRDTCAGPTASKSCVPQTVLAPAGEEDSAANADFDHPAISANGRYVVFQAWVPRPGTGGLESDSHVVLRDTCLASSSPANCVPSSVRVSIAPDGSTLSGVNESASISGDGRFVVFAFQAHSAAGASDPERAFVRDTCLGATAPDGCVPSTTEIMAPDELFAGAAEIVSPWISPSGRFVTFIAAPVRAASGLGEGPQLGSLVIRDTCFGAASSCAARSALATIPTAFSANRAMALPAVFISTDRFAPVPLSRDGRFAAFQSSSAFAALPISGHGDVFLTAVTR
jgi:hypothetical protein